MLRTLGCKLLALHRRVLLQTPPLDGRRTLLTASFQHCWRCGQRRRNVNDPFCEHCKCIQPPHEKDNFFKIFDIPPHYDVDVPSLQRKYRAMQTLLHPDKFANSTKDEKAISEQFSALVNDAYNTLSNPMARALHMLRMHRETIVEDDKSTDNAFLMEIMELNEAVEGVKTERQLRKLHVSNSNMLKELESGLSRTFQDNDVREAKLLAIKMKYYHTLSLKIKEAMTNRGIVD